jgi:plasmid stabilization system protein ParE
LIPYRFHTEAEEELDQTALFYESRVVGLGMSFVLEIERTVTAIREHPDLGSPLGKRTRRAVVHGFPYTLVYRQHADHVLILAVAEAWAEEIRDAGKRGEYFFSLNLYLFLAKKTVA